MGRPRRLLAPRELEAAVEAARGLDHELLPVRPQRLAEVHEVVEYVALGDADRPREIARRGRASAQHRREILPNGMRALHRRSVAARNREIYFRAAGARLRAWRW